MRETNRRLRGHQFMPVKAVTSKLPKLYATDATPAADKIVWVHYFCSRGDWYVTELDPETNEAFGYARLASFPEGAEWGYIDLNELEQIKLSPFGVIERDMHWAPKKFSEIDC